MAAAAAGGALLVAPLLLVPLLLPAPVLPDAATKPGGGPVQAQSQEERNLRMVCEDVIWRVKGLSHIHRGSSFGRKAEPKQRGLAEYLPRSSSTSHSLLEPEAGRTGAAANPGGGPETAKGEFV